MRWHAMGQLILARFREFYREPEVLFWVYGFPVLLAVGLGIAFSSKPAEEPRVDIQMGASDSEASALQAHLRENGYVVELFPAEECAQRLRLAKTELFVVPSASQYKYVYDDTRPESVAARYRLDATVQRWKAGNASWPTVDQASAAPGSRYIDFLLPGLMGLNIMGGGLWGVGFVIVDMRVRKLLKRFVATPMRRADFLISILIARIVFVLPEMVLLILVGRYGFGVPLRGSVLLFGLVILAGAMAFDGIGLMIGSRTEKTETAAGLMNLVQLPMWLVGGTFFSSKRYPEEVQPFIQALPLTQLNDCLRAVLLEGAGLSEIWSRLLILMAWGAVTFMLALRIFRWN